MKEINIYVSVQKDFYEETSLLSMKKRNSWCKFFASIQCDIVFLFKSFYVSLPEASPNMAPKSSQKSIIEMNVDRGSKVHLPCNIQGNPLPIFTWYRLSDSSSYYSVPSSQRIVPSQTVLLIRNVDDRDAGRWVRSNLTISTCLLWKMIKILY